MALEVILSNSEVDNRKVEIAARINVEGDAKNRLVSAGTLPEAPPDD